MATGSAFHRVDALDEYTATKKAGRRARKKSDLKKKISRKKLDSSEEMDSEAAIDKIAMDSTPEITQEDFKSVSDMSIDSPSKETCSPESEAKKKTKELCSRFEDKSPSDEERVWKENVVRMGTLKKEQLRPFEPEAQDVSERFLKTKTWDKIPFPLLPAGTGSLIEPKSLGRSHAVVQGEEERTRVFSGESSRGAHSKTKVSPESISRSPEAHTCKDFASGSVLGREQIPKALHIPLGSFEESRTKSLEPSQETPISKPMETLSKEGASQHGLDISESSTVETPPGEPGILKRKHLEPFEPKVDEVTEMIIKRRSLVDETRKSSERVSQDLESFKAGFEAHNPYYLAVFKSDFQDFPDVSTTLSKETDDSAIAREMFLSHARASNSESASRFIYGVPKAKSVPHPLGKERIEPFERNFRSKSDPIEEAKSRSPPSSSELISSCRQHSGSKSDTWWRHDLAEEKKRDSFVGRLSPDALHPFSSKAADDSILLSSARKSLSKSSVQKAKVSEKDGTSTIAVNPIDSSSEKVIAQEFSSSLPEPEALALKGHSLPDERQTVDIQTTTNSGKASLMSIETQESLDCQTETGHDTKDAPEEEEKTLKQQEETQPVSRSSKEKYVCLNMESSDVKLSKAGRRLTVFSKSPETISSTLSSDSAFSRFQRARSSSCVDRVLSSPRKHSSILDDGSKRISFDGRLYKLHSTGEEISGSIESIASLQQDEHEVKLDSYSAALGSLPAESKDKICEFGPEGEKEYPDRQRSSDSHSRQAAFKDNGYTASESETERTFAQEKHKVSFRKGPDSIISNPLKQKALESPKLKGPRFSEKEIHDAERKWFLENFWSEKQRTIDGTSCLNQVPGDAGLVDHPFFLKHLKILLEEIHRREISLQPLVSPVTKSSLKQAREKLFFNIWLKLHQILKDSYTTEEKQDCFRKVLEDLHEYDAYLTNAYLILINANKNTSLAVSRPWLWILITSLLLIIVFLFRYQFS